MAKALNGSAEEIPRWVVYGAPLASVAVVMLAPFLSTEAYHRWYLSETGFIEISTFVFLVVALGLAIGILRQWRTLPRWVAPWVLCIALASLFFAGEEIDWGQVWLDIQTPSLIEDINREGQFSLHKIDGHKLTRLLFNQGPRLAATLAMAVCFVSPWLTRRLGWSRQAGWRRSLPYWLLPTASVAPIGLLAVVSTWPKKLIKSPILLNPTDPEGYWVLALRKPSGEFKEYCIALAILLYVWSLHRRLRHRQSAPLQDR